MAKTQTTQHVHTGSQSDINIDMLDVAGTLVLVIVGMVVWIFNRNVTQVGKALEKMEAKIEYAHDRITNHIVKDHVKRPED